MATTEVLAIDRMEARRHFETWPPPESRRDFEELMRGSRHAACRWLWPGCQPLHVRVMEGMLPAARERYLIGLYNFRTGSVYPYRWQFWTSPPGARDSKWSMELHPSPPVVESATAADVNSPEARLKASLSLARMRRLMRRLMATREAGGVEYPGFKAGVKYSFERKRELWSARRRLRASGPEPGLVDERPGEGVPF